MFEDRTYENIMAEMMADMPDGLSTEEGSLLFNSCAKQAARLEEAYQFLAGLEQNMFPDTADLEHLIRMGIDRGVYIKQATYAEFEAQFNTEIPAGSRFNLGDYNYTIFYVLDEEPHTYIIGCDTPGAEPNNIRGSLEPIEYIDGFEWGRIINCTTKGADMEDTEEYRQRLLSSYSYRGFAGNREYYMSRIKEFTGVSGCKVERVKAPSDRVKITIIGTDYRRPSDEVIENVQTQVDPIVNSGEGIGIAPIGHRVLILGVEETEINIETTITYSQGYDFPGLESYIKKAVEDYLDALRRTWESEDIIVVRILQIEAGIVDIQGIVDVTGTKINGQEKNYQITDGSIPILGGLICG